MKILYFSLVDWDFIRQRPHHLAERLSAHYDFTFIQPFGMRNPGFSDVGRAVTRLVRILRGKKVNTGLHVRNPLFIPTTSGLVRNINVRIVKPQLQPLFTNQTIVWVTTPSPLVADVLRGQQYKTLIYEIMDDYPRMYPSSHIVGQIERWLVDKADFVITTSEALAEKAKAINAGKPVKVVGNGVDYAFFNRAARDEAEELQGMKRIVGYVGTIDKWIDFETIDFLAVSCPTLDFVFAGPMRTRGLPIPRRKNLHFIGRVDYHRVPVLCNSFDVCLIPFVPGPFADTVNPVKLYEYFALGKPVVAYRMRELLPYADLLYLAEDRTDFAGKMAMALNESGSRMAARRRDVARMNDWSAKAEDLKQILTHFE